LIPRRLVDFAWCSSPRRWESPDRAPVLPTTTPARPLPAARRPVPDVCRPPDVSRGRPPDVSHGRPPDDFLGRSSYRSKPPSRSPLTAAVQAFAPSPCLPQLGASAVGLCC
jgi:hypothetical protein